MRSGGEPGSAWAMAEGGIDQGMDTEGYQHYIMQGNYPIVCTCIIVRVFSGWLHWLAWPDHINIDCECM